jgi:hypothetical protein
MFVADVSHDVWLSRLIDHLQKEKYQFQVVRRRVAVARRFLAYLRKHATRVEEAQASILRGICETNASCIIDVITIAPPQSRPGKTPIPAASTCSCAWFKGSGRLRLGRPPHTTASRPPSSRITRPGCRTVEGSQLRRGATDVAKRVDSWCGWARGALASAAARSHRSRCLCEQSGPVGSTSHARVSRSSFATS